MRISDWSSDVCSSDLPFIADPAPDAVPDPVAGGGAGDGDRDQGPEIEASLRRGDAAKRHDDLRRDRRKDIFQHHQHEDAEITPALDQVEDEAGHEGANAEIFIDRKSKRLNSSN